MLIKNHKKFKQCDEINNKNGRYLSTSWMNLNVLKDETTLDII